MSLTRSPPADSHQPYVLGHGESEVRRLELQGRIFAPGTTRILAAAGLRPGMSVLDVGTGAGDVAMHAADIVGPSGRVLGIDREPEVLRHARARVDAAGLRQVRFQAATFDTLEGTFDLLVWRYVIAFQPDRAAFIRTAARFVRPGGTLLCIEPGLPEVGTLDSADGETHSHPVAPLFEEVVRHILVGFHLAGARIGSGRELVKLFHDAGLPEPAMLREVPTGGPGSPIVEWACLTLQSVLPVLVRHQQTTPDRLDLETLQARVQTAVAGAPSQLGWADLNAAWVTVGR